MHRPIHGRRLGYAVAACLLGATALVGPALAGAAGAAPTASTVASIPAVGPLYFPSVLGLAPTLGLPHSCSASVVDSPGHDLILTAAHCVTGSGLGIEFVPGYHDGQQPYGAWDVSRAYVDPSWLARQDPQHDYAFLQVNRQFWHGGLRAIEDVVGANQLGSAPASGVRVRVDGYLAGSNDRPITCAATVYRTAGYPSFDCAGFADGTSGGPWLLGSGPTARVVGVIGGLHQGGCVASTSYSSAFGADTLRTWLRASARGAGDVMPLAGSDGCPT